MEEDAVEVFHYYGFHLSSSFLMYNFNNKFLVIVLKLYFPVEISL